MSYALFFSWLESSDVTFLIETGGPLMLCQPSFSIPLPLHLQTHAPLQKPADIYNFTSLMSSSILKYIKQAKMAHKYFVWWAEIKEERCGHICTDERFIYPLTTMQQTRQVLLKGKCSHEKRLKDEFKWLSCSMKNSCKYDAEVQPQQTVTTEVFLFSQLYFHEVSEINSARK